MEISIKSDGIRHSEDSGSVGRVLYAEECHKFEYLEGKVKSLTIQGDSSRCALVTLTVTFLLRKYWLPVDYGPYVPVRTPGR